MIRVGVHPIETTAEWWEIAGYHPREIKIKMPSRYWETIEGVLRDDGTKPVGAFCKPEKRFRVTYPANANLGVVAAILSRKIEENEDITNLVLN